MTKIKKIEHPRGPLIFTVPALGLDTGRLEAACARSSEKTEKVLREMNAVRLLAESLVQVRAAR
jgi:hypothetical protein